MQPEYDISMALRTRLRDKLSGLVTYKAC